MAETGAGSEVVGKGMTCSDGLPSAEGMVRLLAEGNPACVVPMDEREEWRVVDGCSADGKDPAEERVVVAVPRREDAEACAACGLP